MSAFNRDILQTTEGSVAMAVRPAREEGLFAGTSTGSNVTAALKLADQLGPGATVMTVMCDTGIKYLSTALFRACTRGDTNPQTVAS